MSAPDRQAIAADAVFDGATVRQDCAVVLAQDRIAAVLPRRELPGDLPLRRLPEGNWLAPGFLDVQVNGGGDGIICCK